MENNERKNNSLTELMEASMSKIRDMVDSNTCLLYTSPSPRD